MKSPWLQTLRQRLFATPVDAAITLVCLYVVWRLSVPLLHWLVFDATWNGTSRDACKGDGACWVFVRVRFSQFMYGQYPIPERWRVDIAGALLVATAGLLSWRGLPHRRGLAIASVTVLPLAGLWLLYGGLGLRIVETREWGGLMLTLVLTIYAGLIAVPLGILLALGRRSRLPLIRFASVVFIEFWRGVPIITVIFLASLLLPLIMPSGFDVDRLARAVLGLAFVIAAYMAEAVRGGLQALPEGQTEAAQALGLGYWRIQRRIVLPQALRIALPAMTNEFIALFKNTTLVLIVSLFDLLGIAQAALADPAWVGMNMEAYVFAGAIYWFACFAMSQWSRRREKRLQAAYGR
ncbi:MAG: amino acid ABC transporter permease [Proteobacteria bacterium]|nr:amino acid ABC transporter permease [Pseudomonadota bacterium]MBS0547284.1 amino acid ABC transporter permease [Pseudomonadota bacterium]